MLKHSEQMMFCSVLDPGSATSFSTAFVYSFNTETQTQKLWKELKEVSDLPLTRIVPFVAFGEFNQVLLATEHFSLIRIHSQAEACVIFKCVLHIGVSWLCNLFW